MARGYPERRSPTNTPTLPRLCIFRIAGGVLELLRSFLAVVREGSVNRAAQRLGVAQPTLSRHIQALEQEFGAPLFERGARGMRPTDLGFLVRDQFGPVIHDYEMARAEAMAFARGRHRQLRVGYLAPAAARCLTPVLPALKREFPSLKLLLFDATPGEQLLALREGRIDVAIVGREALQEPAEFLVRRVARLGVCVALPSEHPLARQRAVALAALRDERFIGVEAEVAPGRSVWLTGLCRRAGFRPRMQTETKAITETFALIAAEGAVALLPDYFAGTVAPPGVVFVPLADPWATWELVALRQRGRNVGPASRCVELLTQLDVKATGKK